jgi:PAS domain S-box-containing protein
MIDRPPSPNGDTPDPGRPANSDAGQTLPIFDRLMRAISGHNSVDTIAQEFAVMTAETLGDLCSIQVLNQRNELIHLAGLYDVDPRALALLEDAVVAMADMPRDQGAAAQVILTGQPLFMPSIPEEALRTVVVPEFVRYVDEVGMSTTMAVPLIGHSSNIGVVKVSRHRGSPAYTQEDLALLTSMSRRMSVAVENIMLIDALRAQVAAASSTRQALTVSEERFRAIFESAALGVEIMDPVGVILDINRAFEKMTGFPRADMVGRPYGTLQQPEDAGPFMQMLTELKMNRQAAPVENRIVRRDGTVIWVRTNLAAVKMAPEDTTISYIVALHEDITGRKQAEQYFQAVLEATPDALVMVDSQGKITLVNRQAENLFGYSRDEILGLTVEALLPERYRDIHPLHRQGYLQNPQLRPMGAGRELHALARDGSEIPVEISLSHVQMDSGPVVVAAIRDITVRKQREVALVRSERSLAEAQSVARLGSLEYDLVTGELNASDEARRILGVTRADPADSLSVQDRIHPDDRQRVIDRSQKVLKTRVPEELEFRVVHPDGSVHIVHDRVAPYFAPNGEPTRILGTIEDVTEEKEAQKEMAELKNHLQSSVELERLRLAQELHDGPMQELYGASYRLEELNRGNDPELQLVLQDVNEQIQNTIGELRAIAKELRPPAISNFGLEKAIRSYVEDFQAKHPTINLQLSLAHDHQLLPEDVRLTLFRVLQQALTNVLRHAQASEVHVRFSLDAEEARLIVSDNGAGFQVPPNWMSFVRQGHYGLAGAAERVNALGGILLVESEPARSTTITAVIPWSPAAR